MESGGLTSSRDGHVKATQEKRVIWYRFQHGRKLAGKYCGIFPCESNPTFFHVILGRFVENFPVRVYFVFCGMFPCKLIVILPCDVRGLLNNEIIVVLIWRFLVWI